MSNRVQFAHAEAAGSGSTIACTLNGIAAGSLIVHNIAMNDLAAFVTGVADDLSAAGSLAIALPTSLETLEQWYHKNHGGGNRTFTATLDTAHTFRGIVSTEVAGVDTDSPLEGTASGTGNSAAPSSGNLTPTPSVDGALIVAVCTGDTVPTAGAPFIEIFSDGSGATNCEHEDYVQPTAAVVAATWAMAPSGNWAALAAVYLPGPATEDVITRVNRSSVPPNVRIAGAE